MKPPKPPFEFDYDLWTTEDGKCMVRVKLTGEECEVDRDTMRLLRAEEKRMRRSRDDELSLDEQPSENIESAWLACSGNYEEKALFRICMNDFRQSLGDLQLSVFDYCMLGGMTTREYASEFNISKSYVSKITKELREKISEFF